MMLVIAILGTILIFGAGVGLIVWQDRQWEKQVAKERAQLVKDRRDITKYTILTDDMGRYKVRTSDGIETNMFGGDCAYAKEFIKNMVRIYTEAYEKENATWREVSCNELDNT